MWPNRSPAERLSLPQFLRPNPGKDLSSLVPPCPICPPTTVGSQEAGGSPPTSDPIDPEEIVTLGSKVRDFIVHFQPYSEDVIDATPIAESHLLKRHWREQASSKVYEYDGKVTRGKIMPW
ncbi:hypothetical protein ACN38_g9667 [Penicillium nordicum]|uniref:Uncharacterized protein n=1 Tax=Penicillium nordicum TaxID=229535 RepID=A0A0M9WCM9_9EURO|nr:hypothetical protein ACN38_g9667 [Penicillium nordicum]